MSRADQRSSLLVVASAVLAYCMTPLFDFVFDDRKQVLGNLKLTHLGSIPNILFTAEVTWLEIFPTIGLCSARG